MKATGANVGVYLEKMTNDRVRFLSGEIEIDPSWHIEDHVVVHGRVDSIGKRVNEISSQIKVGDKVYMSYFAVLMALGKFVNEAVEFANEKFVEVEKGVIVFIDIRDCFFSVRKGEGVIMLNKRLLVRKVIKKLRSDFIEIPSHVQGEVVENQAEVLHGGNKYKKGSIVVCKDHHMERVGYSMHNKALKTFLDVDDEIYTIRQEDVMAVTKWNLKPYSEKEN